MKKLLILFTVLFCLAALLACNGETATTTENTSQNIPSATAEPIVRDNYTAIPNAAVWSVDAATDTSRYTLVGTGKSCVSQFDKEHNGYQKTYALIDENGNEVTSTKKALQALDFVGATITKDSKAKTAKIVVTTGITPKLEPDWISVSAKGGYYLTFEFTTNLNTKFSVTVTTKEGGDAQSAIDQQDGITVEGENGKYVGIAKCNVPRVVDTKYYINICIDDGSKYPVLASIPLTTTELQYPGPYTLLFQGEWQAFRDETYIERLTELFYTVYPRQYARFGTGSEPKTITFTADPTYDGAAKAGGSDITLSFDYGNSNPDDIGYFSHELVHIIAAYSGKITHAHDGGWWSENLANYGGYRYFHWGTTAQNVQIHDLSAQSTQDWGYDPYGNNTPFFAYMDAKYPTTDKNNDGKITEDEYGLIDTVHFTIKRRTGSTLSDDPNNVNSAFNQAVAKATNGKYACIEEVRKAFEKECEEGTYSFVGFGDYADNFLTEGISYLPDPAYPTLHPATPGDKTATALSTPVLEGENLALGASVVKVSHDTAKQPIGNLLDGDLETYWQGSKNQDGAYLLMEIPQGVVIDLGEVKSFNTYTMVCRGYDYGNKTTNAKAWEILVSTDGETFVSLDYQTENKADAVSFNVGEVTARYIEIRFYVTDQNASGTVRMQEFMLFKQ